MAKRTTHPGVGPYPVAPGPGLRILGNDSDAPWYGAGHCGICGDHAEGSLQPRLVRWWDPDDGWKLGVLCRYCAEECAVRGPHEGDYASPRSENGMSIGGCMDVVADLCGDDYDGALALCEDLL